MKLERKLLGVDIDGTLCGGVCWTPEDCLQAKPIIANLESLAELYNDNFIVIYTARRDNLMPATLEWLEKNNVKYHAISNKKIPLDHIIDEDALRFVDIQTGDPLGEEEIPF